MPTGRSANSGTNNTAHAMMGFCKVTAEGYIHSKMPHMVVQNWCGSKPAFIFYLCITPKKSMECIIEGHHRAEKSAFINKKGRFVKVEGALFWRPSRNSWAISVHKITPTDEYWEGIEPVYEKYVEPEKKFVRKKPQDDFIR